MITFNVCPKRLAALRLIAPRSTWRSDYMNGVAIDLGNGLMMATNGHRAMSFPVDIKRGANGVVTVNLPKGAKIPARANTVRFDIDEPLSTISAGSVTALDADGVVVASFPLTRVGGTFPDVKNVMPEMPFVRDSRAKHSAEFVAFNPMYVSDIAKALKANIVDMAPGDGSGPIPFRFGIESGSWAAFADISFVLMPVRRGD